MVFILVGTTSALFESYLHTGMLPTSETDEANGE